MQCSWFHRLAILSLSCVAWACGPKLPPRPPSHAHYGALIPTVDLGPPFMVEQQLSGQYGTQDVKLECVVQLSKGKLTVLGLTPFGTRAFSIEQVGTDVHFEQYVERDIPFDPVHVLYDLHRVFFRRLRAVPGKNGMYAEQDHGEMLRERWDRGVLVERRYESLEGPVANIIIVTYEGPPAPVIARRVKITNVAYSYTLTIDNVEQKLLEAGYELEVETQAAPPSSPPPPPPPQQ
jgi:hypothetical protein